MENTEDSEMENSAMNGRTRKAALAKSFEWRAEQALIDRGPPVVKAKGGKARLLHIVGTDGKPTGKIATHGQVLAGVAKLAEIDLAVQDGKRPRTIVCADCRMVVHVLPRGPIPTRCKNCRRNFLAREWKRKNRDKARAAERSSRGRNKEQYAAKKRERYRKNRQVDDPAALARHRDADRKYRQKNKDKARELSRKRTRAYRERLEAKRKMESK